MKKFLWLPLCVFLVSCVDEDLIDVVSAEFPEEMPIDGTSENENPDSDKNDDEVPDSPANFKYSNIGRTLVDLEWDTATDDVGVIGYNLYQNGTSIGIVDRTTYRVTKLAVNTAYDFGVAAVDASGKESEMSILVVATEDDDDKLPPSAPGNLTIANIEQSSADLSWSPATDNAGVTSYNIHIDDLNIATPTQTSYNLTDLDPDTSYEVVVTAVDAAGNESEAAQVTISTTEMEDGEAPSTPANFKASEITENSLRLTWNASQDNVGVTAYNIYHEEALIGTPSNRSLRVNDLQPGTSYTFVITAVDAAGNESFGRRVHTATLSDEDPITGGVKASTFGYNPTDATLAIKNAINSDNDVIIIDRQNSDWIVGPLTFIGLSNKTIVFEPGVVLRAKVGGFPNTSHRLFQLIDCSDVTLIGNNTTFQMNKSEYTTGEQRHALSLLDSRNITVSGFTFRDSGGDGIYISRTAEGLFNENIVIDNVVCTNNKRQGISIISVDGLRVTNSTFKNSIGALPAAGVDIEPEAPEDRLANIEFENCDFTGNYGEGILFSLSKTDNTALPMTVTFKDVYVSDNFSSSNERFPVEIKLGMTSDFENPIRGSVVFDGLLVENSDWGGIWSKKTHDAYTVDIRNAMFRNLSQNSEDPVIHLGLLGYNVPVLPALGGYNFENVTIDYDGVDPSLEIFGPSQKSWNLLDMTGRIRVISPNGTRVADNLDKLTTVPLQVTN
ncbi:fibronectin type III domain-containing protein [Spongiimicrobium salis]|uniref:fibronectin type III domain-containing protein n=1 Tax=Spongiimicrobium salis TaxID=1667022 RepID=UPI00374D1754